MYGFLKTFGVAGIAIGSMVMVASFFAMNFEDPLFRDVWFYPMGIGFATFAVGLVWIAVYITKSELSEDNKTKEGGNT